MIELSIVCQKLMEELWMKLGNAVEIEALYTRKKLAGNFYI